MATSTDSGTLSEIISVNLDYGLKTLSGDGVFFIPFSFFFSIGRNKKEREERRRYIKENMVYMVCKYRYPKNDVFSGKNAIGRALFTHFSSFKGKM